MPQAVAPVDVARFIGGPADGLTAIVPDDEPPRNYWMMVYPVEGRGHGHDTVVDAVPDHCGLGGLRHVYARGSEPDERGWTYEYMRVVDMGKDGA